jgi:hypothetical protein
VAVSRLSTNTVDTKANQRIRATTTLTISRKSIMSIEAMKPTTWVSKEQLLQDWLPRLWDALRDVRNKENAAAEETLYELYVEMKQQTIAEKIDTMSEITPEDQLSAVIAELQATQKRLADTENILCRQHFEQAQKQCKYPNCDYPCMDLPDCEQTQKQSTVNQFHPDYADEAINEMTLTIQKQAMRIEELEQAQKEKQDGAD